MTTFHIIARNSGERRLRRPAEAPAPAPLSSHGSPITRSQHTPPEHRSINLRIMMINLLSQKRSVFETPISRTDCFIDFLCISSRSSKFRKTGGHGKLLKFLAKKKSIKLRWIFKKNSIYFPWIFQSFLEFLIQYSVVQFRQKRDMNSEFIDFLGENYWFFEENYWFFRVLFLFFVKLLIFWNFIDFFTETRKPKDAIGRLQNDFYKFFRTIVTEIREAAENIEKNAETVRNQPIRVEPVEEPKGL